MANQPYLWEEFEFFDSIVISASNEMERANLYCPDWVCFYDITFRIGVQLPLHIFMNMVLDHFQLAPSQLMPNGWCYLLGLIVLSKQYSLQIDITIFLNFFYLKPCEGRFPFYPRRKVRIPEDALNLDKEWKDKHFFVKREDLFVLVGTSDSGICSPWSTPGNISLS